MARSDDCQGNRTTPGARVVALRHSLAARSPLGRMAGLCILVAVANVTVFGQEPAKRPPLVAYDRTERCLTCHADLKSGTDFIANMSAKTWQEEDKHRRAMLLLEEQPELTARILGFPLKDVVQDGQLRADVRDRAKIQAVAKCMRCHATWPKPKVPELPDEPPVELRLGVSCQACHGPGFHWSRPHEEKWWRLCAAEEKERLGLVNLRNSAVKAALCTSCHVGSAEEDRQVTHAMYAAGHPPLPGFELAAFALQMPAHWRTLAEKGAFVGTTAAPYVLTAQDRVTLSQLPIDPAAMKNDYRAAHFPLHGHDPATDLIVPKEVLAGGIASLRRYVEQVEISARQQVEGSGGWPDFSLFDCRACHHELRGGRNPDLGSAQRARRTPPGRPPAAAWASILAEAAAGHLGARDAGQETHRPSSFEQALEAFQQALTARPLGDPKKTVDAAGRLREQLDALARSVAVARFDERAANRLMTRLCQDEPTVAGFRPSADYHAARQVAWSLELLRISPSPERAGPAVRELLPSYFRGTQGEDPLQLRLPAGQKSSIVSQLPAALAAPENYDPQWFRQCLERLNAEISRRAD